MDTERLAAIKDEWLQVCPSCDAGLLAGGCTHPGKDYRPVLLELANEVQRLRRCGSKHATNASFIPCMLDRGHDGDHWSTSGCAGGSVHWPTAESDPDEARAKLAKVRELVEEPEADALVLKIRLIHVLDGEAGETP